jgi:hypothetical protein
VQCLAFAQKARLEALLIEASFCTNAVVLCPLAPLGVGRLRYRLSIKLLHEFYRWRVSSMESGKAVQASVEHLRADFEFCSGAS